MLSFLPYIVVAVSGYFPALAQTSVAAGWHVTVPAKAGLTFQMKVNGKGPYETVFDTGAVNLMSANFARQFQLQVQDKPLEFGAIGGSVKARTVHVDTLTMGELKVENQTFYVLDIPSDAGSPQMAVGWEFLQMFAVKMDAQRNELTFFEGTHFRYEGNGKAVPIFLHRNGNGIDVDAKVGHTTGRFLIDSGNQFGTFLSSTFVTENDLLRKLKAHYRGYNGRGFGGESPAAWYVRVPGFELGGLRIKGTVMRLQTAEDSFDNKLSGNIGQDILQRFVITFDCKHALMYLEPAPGWSKPAAFNRVGILVDFNHESDEVKTVLPGSPAAVAGPAAGGPSPAHQRRKAVRRSE